MLSNLKKLYDLGDMSLNHVSVFEHHKDSIEYPAVYNAIVMPLNKGCITMDGIEYPCDVNSFLNIKAGTKISFKCTKDKGFRHINLFYYSDMEVDAFRVVLGDSKKLHEILFSIYELQKTEYPDKIQIHLLFQDFFRTLFGKPERANEDLDILFNAIDFMNDNPNLKIDLKILAEHCKTCTNRISYIFYKYTKKRPIDYFIDIKMDIACVLLAEDKYRISEISLLLGYNDPYYFSRIFKKRIGLAPSQYRRYIRDKR